MKKNTVKQAIAIFLTMMFLIVVQYVVATERNKNDNKETKQEDQEDVVKTEVENLVIEIPEQNSIGTVTIVTYDKNTGEEVTTKVKGTIKVLNNGYNGEQEYLLYTIEE